MIKSLQKEVIFMHKRKFDREEERRKEEEKSRARTRRNWIICIVSLSLAVFCYFFLDGIIANLKML